MLENLLVYLLANSRLHVASMTQPQPQVPNVYFLSFVFVLAFFMQWQNGDFIA